MLNRVREKVGAFDYQSGKSQGIFIYVLGMNLGRAANRMIAIHSYQKKTMA